MVVVSLKSPIEKDRLTTNSPDRPRVVRPRIMVGGVGGDSGKTLVTLGLIDTWRNEGYKIASFKKGPDYIDTGWLKLASGTPARNLDTWMMGSDGVVRSFTNYGIADGINVIEGNRGLHDGEDAVGSHSTAIMAKLLKCPVVIVIPVTKVTRTVAAIALGVKMLDPDVQIAGIILNRVGTARQETIIRRAVEDEAGLPVVGAIYRSKRDLLPGRHLGLVTPEEHDQAQMAVSAAGRLVRESVDWKHLAKLTRDVEVFQLDPPCVQNGEQPNGRGLRIGYFAGSAFTFYYPENLEALEATGAELIKIDPLKDKRLPNLDVLYIGGGFPETHAVDLSGNESFRHSVAEQADKGLPIWAECGGLMFLSQHINYNGNSYPMAGALPITVSVSKRPQGHGYQAVIVDRENPFIPVGTLIRGHEFHYSQVDVAPVDTAFEVKRGVGIGNRRDGIIYKNIMASYLHIHATAFPKWCDGIISAGHSYNVSCQVRI